MKIAFLVFVLGIFFRLAVSQDLNNRFLPDPGGVEVLPDSAAGIPHAEGFSYSPPWSHYQTDNVFLLPLPKVLEERRSMLYSIHNAGLSLFNSSERVTYPHFGGFFQMKSDVVFSPFNKVIFRMGGTVIRQDTPEQSHSQMQYGVCSAVGYSFANWLTFRLYGQRLWYLNPEHVSPLLLLNPLFPHTAVGAELSTKINNVQMGLGSKAIFDPQFNSSQHLNLINTKVSIGF
jgi:hypothetical protein